MKAVIILLMLISCCFVNSGDKKKEYITIVEESKLKTYNPNAVWIKVSCKHCNGTGCKIEQKYDAKKNTMIKWMTPCPYCKGSGTSGMSKM